jgi:hypothetical protein
LAVRPGRVLKQAVPDGVWPVKPGLIGRSVREIGQLLGNGKPVSRQTVYRALGMLAT